MKKFNKSLILPIIYAAASLFGLICALKDGYISELFDLVSFVMLLASIAAIILIAVFKPDLKKNFLLYVISILVSAAGIFISLFTGGYILILIVSILLLIAQSVIYWLRKASKSEIIVWLLLNPVHHFLISLLLLESMTMY